MTELEPTLEHRRKVDADHLKLLAIFHFVGAGLAALGMLFLFAHYSFMHLFFANPKMWEGQKGGPPPAEFFAIFQWFYVAFGLWFFVSLTLNLVSAFCLRARKHRTFSLVVAGINCVHMPLGTVLGVFTMIVLLRDSVREAYQT
jgi:hypothetical protein